MPPNENKTTWDGEGKGEGVFSPGKKSLLQKNNHRKHSYLFLSNTTFKFKVL